MRVKRLEVQGFKSFKDKTVIHFDHSITGIVGPNGCGKSNIVDAFFWVMGEQSYKHMRGSSSEDLIFNGSSKYAPLGYAEATLILETDVPDTENAPTGATAQDLPVHLRAKEISVTRRVYRTGEGEYFINGVSARLKDIQELFMDTGVGAKGYSVVEQGQIGKIVNAKPEDRRLLVEEAAGIAKYKARKKESLRKMEATEGNLSRLTDVIQEIDRGLESLERQAQKTRLYNKYKDELLDKEMTWGRRKTKVIKQKLEVLQKERVVLEQDLVALRVELQISENNVESDRIALTTNTKKAEDLQIFVHNLSTELTRLQSALDLSTRRQGDLDGQLTGLQKERQVLEQTLQADRTSIAGLEEKTKQSGDVFAALESRLNAKDQEVAIAKRKTEEMRKSVDNAQKSLFTIIAEAATASSQVVALSSRAQAAMAQAEKLDQQVLALSEKTATVKGDAEKAKTNLEQTQTKIRELQSLQSSSEANLLNSEAQHRAAEVERANTDKRLVQLKSKLQSLEELADSHEGFGDGPKAVLEWAREAGFASQIGTIADAIDVQKGYEIAAQGWLEGRLESIVSSDFSVAHKALLALTDKNQGRAIVHFAHGSRLPSDKANTFHEQIAKAGFVIRGTLNQFVTVCGDSALHALTRSLIDNVYVVESIIPAVEFLKNSDHYGFAIVSLDGSVLDLTERTATIRGGSLESSNASLLVRRRTINELHSEVEKASSAYEHALSAAETTSAEVANAREKLAELKNDVQALQVQLAAQDRDVHQTSRQLKEVESQLELAQLEAGTVKEEVSTCLSESENAKQRTSELSEKRRQLEEDNNSRNAELVVLEAEFRNQEDALNALRIEEASLKERVQSAKRELESALSILGDREYRLAEVIRGLERAGLERMQFNSSDGEIQTRIQDLLREMQIKTEELNLVRNGVEELNAKQTQGMEKIKLLHSNIDQKTLDSNQQAIEFEKQNAELNHLIQSLEERYGAGCLETPVTSPIQEEMSDPVVTAEMTEEEEKALGEQVEWLRQRLHRLGEVNPLAIQEFEELKRRHDTLVGEKQDLEHSMENLKEAIEHINKTSEERFRKAFEAIASRFEKLFPIIFAGGQAKLSLVYPEGSTDILEAGVDILAQPPGKKVSNITLLSGGEKALTAVSLIFAIFMVKPSPFCILDEVDAPLDDANIGKFNALLREMSAKSQFILITHNKRTMELNDTLYGVTMEEPGVSKMVSIEMR